MSKNIFYDGSRTFILCEDCQTWCAYGEDCKCFDPLKRRSRDSINPDVRKKY